MKKEKRSTGLMMVGSAMLGLALMGGCANDKMKAENQELQQDNAKLTAQRDAALKAQRTAQADRDRAYASIHASQGDGRATGLEGTPGVSQSTNANGEEQIEIQGDVLFDTAKATIKPAFKKTLDKIAEVMTSTYADRQFRIEGHTDPRKVKASGWDDNWDLGAARARAVTLYLISRGVPKKDVYIASFADNDLRSTTDFAQDRRVDIVVVK